MADEQKPEDKKDDKPVEVPEKFKDLVEKVEKLSVMELAELVKVLEEKFGVSAQAPVAVAAAPAAGDDDGENEQSSFNVELTEAGPNKISVIKVVREVTEKGLKDSKDMVDAAPKVIKEGATKEEAEGIKKKIEEAGGKAVLK